MLSDVEEGSNLILTLLTPVATLIDTKQQSATTSFSTRIVTFSCHLWNRHDARVESHTHAKRNDCYENVTSEIKYICIEENRKYF